MKIPKTILDAFEPHGLPRLTRPKSIQKLLIELYRYVLSSAGHQVRDQAAMFDDLLERNAHKLCARGAEDIFLSLDSQLRDPVTSELMACQLTVRYNFANEPARFRRVVFKFGPKHLIERLRQ